MQVIGNLGKDCVTNLVNGKNVINFNVAHTEKFRDAKGEQKEKTVSGLRPSDSRIRIIFRYMRSLFLMIARLDPY